MFLRVRSLDEVQAFLEGWPVKVREEKIRLSDACGRVSFSDARAPFPLPPFDKSLMDGYALMARDTFGASEMSPVRLRIKETISAGDLPKTPIRKGQTSYVATGACLPRGADSVVMVENTRSVGASLEVTRAASVGEHVLPTGHDFSEGDLLFSRGTLLGPRHIGLLSSFGMAKVSVSRKPRVAIASSGNEIVGVGGKGSAGKVFDTNGPTLAAYVEQMGGEAHFLGIARDDRRSLGEMLGRARRSDLILFSAGASAGTRDLLSSTLAEAGKVHFHGLAVKPGKPTIVGELSGKLFFGLPGNPTSCLTIFFLLVAPHLARMQGRRVSFKKMRLPCAARIFSAKGKRHFVAVTIRDGLAHPHDKGSGAYSTFFFADGCAAIPEDVEFVEEGDIVDVVLFGDGNE